MSRWREKFSQKNRRRVGIVMVCLLLFAGIHLAEGYFTGKLYDQQMADRWSNDGKSAQISCFFQEGEIENVEYFTGLGRMIDEKLVQSSLTAPNEQARLKIDAISLPGKVSISYGSKSVELAAFGVKGEFFQFHPLTLRTGAYFGSSSIMQDGIIIDEETAWQLFGSNHVAGLEVMIGQVPHRIAGVIHRDRGRLADAAGLDESICYLSLDSLQKNGQVTGGYCYEVVMPNLVEGFSYSILEEVLGKEKRAVLRQNTDRFSILVLVRGLMEFGTRSMSKEGIIYPYWENLARGYEDILLLTLFFKLLLLAYPMMFMLLGTIKLWKSRTWRTADLYRLSKDVIYDLQVKQRQKKEKP